MNPRDLESGNAGKVLAGRTGAGRGNWRLKFSIDRKIEMLACVRTADGLLTAMRDMVQAAENVRCVANFNPCSNRSQASRLRLVNPGAETANVTIRGRDNEGKPGTGEVSLSLAAGTAREITAAQLESGAMGLNGALGDGFGKWRLEVESAMPIVAMSLLESPTAHLTNLSTVPSELENGVHLVALFPTAGEASGRQGFVRVVNRSAHVGEVRIKAHDETDWDYRPLTLFIGANQAAHFDSDDLELGSSQKGLWDGTGAEEGDWWLELTRDLDIDVLAFIRTLDGFLTAMHDLVPSLGNTRRVVVFNPGSDRNQESLLRIVNAGGEPARARVAGIDGNGEPGTCEVSLFVPVGDSRTVAAWELEDGALGDGAGKWQLTVTADAPVLAMSAAEESDGTPDEPVDGAAGCARGSGESVPGVDLGDRPVEVRELSCARRCLGPHAAGVRDRRRGGTRDHEPVGVREIPGGGRGGRGPDPEQDPGSGSRGRGAGTGRHRAVLVDGAVFLAGGGRGTRSCRHSQNAVRRRDDGIVAEHAAPCGDSLRRTYSY